MKPLAVFFSMMVFVGFASATIGTYTGDVEGEGSENSFMVGVASDRPLTIELDVEEREGLNISYNSSMEFDPGNTSRSVQYSGERLPLKELYVDVVSDDPVETVYEIPVVLRAFSDENRGNGEASPRVIHEREYSFYYRTELSSNHGLEGDLIRPETGSEEESGGEEPETNVSEENPITGENQTSSQGESQETGSGSRTTYILVLGILAVFGYTLKEALL